MNHLKAIVLVTVLCANAVLAQEQSSISPASNYRQVGVTVVSPNQRGWVLVQSSNVETVFEKRVKDEMLLAQVKTIKTKIFDNHKDLLISLEALKKEELKKLKMESVHFNHVRFKGSPCLQYDGIFNVDGATAPNFRYFNLKGYFCGHPETKDVAVQIEFSNRSNVRGFSEDLVSLSEEFFEGMVFSKAPAIVSSSDPSKDAGSALAQANTQKAFFANLKKLCGKRFEGETVFPPDKDHPLAGKRLVMFVETCREKEIRIPFYVGEDKSRTWVLTMTDAGLLLKHDHRHADGTPDKITMYGGLAAPSGTEYMQSFPADTETIKIIPEAGTNVWTLEIDLEKQHFMYYLERNKQPRYKALFNLKFNRTSQGFLIGWTPSNFK